MKVEDNQQNLLNNVHELGRKMDKKQQLDKKQKDNIWTRKTKDLYCYQCYQYTSNIHYCKQEGKYRNVDMTNLILIRGSTEESVQGYGIDDIGVEVTT